MSATKSEEVFVAVIEERFLSAQADAFAGSEREEKASACSVRNDRLGPEAMSGLGRDRASACSVRNDR
jgi:hypothetical protein